MARLPLDQGIPRFKANEDRIDIMTNGDENATWRTADGTEVPSVRKFMKEMYNEFEAAGVIGILPGPYADDSEAATAFVGIGKMYRRTDGVVAWRQA